MEIRDNDDNTGTHQQSVEVTDASSRGANVLKELMIGKNYSINQSNIYRNGNFDFRINGYPLLLLNGVKKYVKRKMPQHKLRELLVKDCENLIDVFASDCVIFLDIEVVELIKRLYMDIKYEKNKYNLHCNYKELRSEYLHTHKRPFKRKYKSDFSKSGQDKIRTEKNKKKCLDFNKKGNCSYKNCKFGHECSICNSSQHGAVHCPTV